MDDHDLYESLKTAAPKLIGRIFDWAKQNPGAVGAGIGTAAAGLGSYLAYRPSKKDGLSLEQKLYNSKTEREPEGEGYARGIASVVGRTAKNMANVAAKHPAKAALTFAPTGASLGAYLGNKLFKR